MKLPYPIDNVKTYYDLRDFYQKIRSFKIIILLLAVIVNVVTIIFISLYYLGDKDTIFSFLGPIFGGLTFVLWIMYIQWHIRQKIIRQSMISSSFYDKSV